MVSKDFHQREPGEAASLHAAVHGRVQGVFYRNFTAQAARRLGVAGYVRNVPDGTVEVRAEGEKKQLEKLLEQLKEGPSGARVTSVMAEWQPPLGEYQDFKIVY